MFQGREYTRIISIGDRIDLQGVLYAPIKQPVRLRAQAAVADPLAAAPDVVDGLVVSVGDRILLSEQGDPITNGFYSVDVVGTGADGVWSRTTDMALGSSLTSKLLVTVQEGTNAGNVFSLDTAGAPVVGVDALPWRSISGLFTGNIVWVDAVAGNDASGQRENAALPFLTIQAAITAAVAGDAVLVRPGTYNELLVMKDGVSVMGVNAQECVLARNAAGPEVVVTMAENMLFSMFRLDLVSSGGGGLTGISFAGTSNATSRAQNIEILGSGTLVVPVRISGAGVAAEGTATLMGVQATGSNGAALAVTAGTSRVANSRFYSTTGLDVQAGTVALTSTSIEGVTTGISNLGTVEVDFGSTWYGQSGVDLTGAGVLSTSGSGAGAPSATAFSGGNTVINNAAPTLLSTLGPLNAQQQRVFVTFSCILDNTTGGNREVTFFLYRNGVEINPGDRWIQRVETGDDFEITTMDWVDSSPGNQPVYTILAQGSAAGTRAIQNRRGFATVVQIN